ncbi:MAG: hypothetical protein RXR02_04070 [Thermoproteus sp.]
MGAASPLSMGYRTWALLLVALHAADAALTLFCMHRFPNCLEGNPVLAALGGGPRSPWVVAPSAAGVAMLLFIGRRHETILRIAVYIKAAIVTYSLFLILHPTTGSAPHAASRPPLAHPMRRPPPSPF